MFTSRFVVFCCLVVVTSGSCSSAPKHIATYGPAADRRVIQNVHVVDVEKGVVIKNQDLWMRRGRIEAIVPTGQIKPDSLLQVFPGKDRYVLPGLIDGHVHVEGQINPVWNLEIPSVRANLERFLYGGTTTIIDLGGGLAKLEQASRFLDEGRYNGPDLFFAGPGITAIDGHPAPLANFVRWPFKNIARKHLAVEVSSREDIEKALQNIKRKGGRFAKFILDEVPVGAPKLQNQLFMFGVQRAKAMNLFTVAHIGTNLEARLAVEAGIHMLAHNVYREAIEQRTLDEIRVANVPVVLTVGVFQRLTELSQGRSVVWSAMTNELSDPLILESWQQKPPADKFSFQPAFDQYLKALEINQAVRLENAKAIRAAGIPIVIGSDSTNSGWQAGAALHEEMKMLVEQVGYTPAEIVRAATAGNAKVFDFRDRGKLEKEYRADILIVNRNPLEDINALSDIFAVFLEGSLVSRQAPKYQK